MVNKIRKSICFVGLDNYSFINPFCKNAYLGGESVQQNLLAKAFKDLNYSVSMIVKDHGQLDGEIRDGIKIWKTFKEHNGLPAIRFFYPRLISIFRALKNADTDIYYQSCAGMITGLVAWFCIRNNRKFIFRAAHDTDCIRNQQLIRFWRDKKLFEYGIKRAQIIAVQSVTQQKLMKDNYNLDSVPIKMAVEMPKQRESQNKDIDILWVNNMRPFKRPEICIEIAKKFPKYRVVMIGGPCAEHMSYYKKIEQKAKKVKNLSFVGFIPYHKINKYFWRTRLFINTSRSEGFPNSYLQAWIRGVPVITFFDPDNLIVNNDLGSVALNLNDMEKCINRLIYDKQKRIRLGKTAKHFVINNYSPKKVVYDYLKLIK